MESVAKSSVVKQVAVEKEKDDRRALFWEFMKGDMQIVKLMHCWWPLVDRSLMHIGHEGGLSSRMFRSQSYGVVL